MEIFPFNLETIIMGLTTITGNTAQVNSSVAEVKAYLANMNNFEHLLPSDKISDFQGGTEKCSFKIQAAATINLVLKEVTESSIIYGSAAPTPFRFTLTVSIEEVGETCVVSQVCEAELNAMLKMMVEKPLTKLFNHIAEQLEKNLA
ncbi:MAG: carbon monoxide dehydrogenase subunit G [Luteibaculaceae bacterium]|jgi:carbon monoxide dehydrogenase subunit G